MTLKVYLGCVLFLSSCLLSGCNVTTDPYKKRNINRAEKTLECLYKNYSVENTCLLRETYPFKSDYSATYLASIGTDNVKERNQYSYLWPYSGTLSAIIALYEATGNELYRKMLESNVLVGLEEYFDMTRDPFAYASYISTDPVSDRYYDDNVWLGIDFVDLFTLTDNKEYLDKAELIWDFIESGMDENLGGGIYWCEQKKLSKNTCSNAPGSVFALKLFMATGESVYFYKGVELYDWTKNSLQDTADFLYFDNINLNGEINKAKYSYNSGQMIQASSLLYKLTGEDKYLTDCKAIAKAGHNYFFSEYDNGKDEFRLLRNGDNWFYAVMLRGYLELYSIDKNPVYLKDIQKSLDYAWDEIRDKKGLFEDRRFGGPTSGNHTKWLLTQAAMVEMYARLSNIN